MGYPSCRRSGSFTRSPIWRAATKAGVKTEIETFLLAEADAAPAWLRAARRRRAGPLGAASDHCPADGGWATQRLR
jgi:hypothetical protein